MADVRNPLTRRQGGHFPAAWLRICEFMSSAELEG
jgi:hypothetical protein